MSSGSGENSLPHPRVLLLAKNAESCRALVSKVCECLQKKQPVRQTRAPLTTFHTTYPFEMVSIDFLPLETCKQGFKYILVVMDNFTRFAQAYATKDKSAKTVAEKLFNYFVLKFGFPC